MAGTAITVGEALARWKASLGAPAADPPYEGLVAGAPDREVTGILACAMPSIDMLNRARAQRCNLILADGHPFYLYNAGWASQRGIVEALETSPVVQAKKALIAEGGLAVVRLTSAWNAARPQAAPMAFATALGLRGAAGAPDRDFVVADMKPTTLDALAATCARTAGIDGMRLIGPAASPVRRVAVASGLVTPARMRRMIADPAVGAVICGEVNEWEAGPYMQDVVATGRPMALVLCGFAVSREPLAAPLAEWVRSVLPGVRVESAVQPAPIWSSRTGERA